MRDEARGDDAPEFGPKGYLPPRAAAQPEGARGDDAPEFGPKGYLPPRAAAQPEGARGDDAPEFGPKGYLPPRAAARARKIVLREPMVIGWPLAAVTAAVVLAVVGAVFLLRSGAPGAPFVAVGPPPDLSADDRVATIVVPVGGDALVVRAGGGLRTFAAPDATLRWCPESRRLESATGDVFTPEGVRLGGDGTSLAPVPSVVYEQQLYVDAEALTDPEPLPAAEEGVDPVCTAT